MKDLMIDLETLGTNVDAPVISIGAVYFDIESRSMGNTFYETLDVADQIDTKIRFADSSTIKWWMSQADAAKNVFKEGSNPSKVVMSAFRQWIMLNSKAGKTSKQTTKCIPWGNGSGFDITLMETMFKDYDVQCPWMFWNVMDLRTFRRFIGKGRKVEKHGVDHNAMFDAKSQVIYMFECTDIAEGKPVGDYSKFLEA